MKFSIITPSFNQLDWLRLCIASVRNQVEAPSGGRSEGAAPQSPLSYPKSVSPSAPSPVAIEHIIQDAGTPGIEEFAREVGAEFHRDGALVFASTGDRRLETEDRIESSPDVAYHLTIHCERDGGMYDAVNRGFEKATGELMAYLNCDEQYLPGALRSVTERFSREPNLEMLFADAVVVEKDGKFLCFRKAQVPFRDQLWFRMPVLTCATFLRRRVFAEKQVRLDETKKVLGDVIWIMRAQERKIRMGTLRRFTSAFTETDANLGVGGAADREFLELRARMPGHVRRGIKLYELWHKVRSVLSGSRHAAPFSYEIYTDFDLTAKKSFDVPHPTAVWKGRTGVDQAALARAEK